MRALTESDVLGSFVNADPDELRLVDLPQDFGLIDWDFRDFLAWVDPATRRGYVVVEVDQRPIGVVLRASGVGRARSGMCNICHTMQSGNQVALFSARRSGASGSRGDSVGTYICADLSCHEKVRYTHPLAPNEVRRPGQIDMRLDGTLRRMESFARRVLDTAA